MTPDARREFSTWRRWVYPLAAGSQMVAAGVMVGLDEAFAAAAFGFGAGIWTMILVYRSTP